MPEEKYSYTVERHTIEHNGSLLNYGWKLRLERDGEHVKRGGIFTPNGGWDSADELARDAAHEVGQQWVEDNTPKAEIPW